MREYSRLELSRKLKVHASKATAAVSDSAPEGVPSDSAAEIEALLDEFAERGWLSEARYVEQAVNGLARRYGPRRVAQRLEANGISRESVAAVLPYLKSEALATARTLLARKFRAAIESPEDKARRVRFLQARGFDYDVIRKALFEPQDESLTDNEAGN